MEKLRENIEELPFEVDIEHFFAKDSSGNFLVEKLGAPSSELKTLSVYDLPSLMRVLCEKSEVVDPEQSSSEVVKDDYTICKVLNWTSFDKRILTFTFDSLKNFNPNIFANFLEESQPVLESKVSEELGPPPKEKYKTSRVFPRYNVNKFNMMISSKDRPKIKVLDLSASGLKVSSKSNFPLNTPLLWEINYLKYSIPIICTPLWSEYEGQTENFYIGCKLSLSDPKDFDQWIKLMKAIHLYVEKKG